jgi:hypothetical protein
MKRTTRILLAAPIAGLLGQQIARADSNGATVSQGIQCQATQAQYDHFTRDTSGISNNQTSTRKLYCPVNTPSYDSDRSQNPVLQFITVMFSGSAPTCFLYARSQTGSVTMSAQSKAGFIPRTLEFGAGRFKSPDGLTASLGYVCDLPPGSKIHGAHANFDLSEPDDGGRITPP